jgi:hypothetical protein
VRRGACAGKRKRWITKRADAPMLAQSGTSGIFPPIRRNERYPSRLLDALFAQARGRRSADLVRDLRDAFQ